MVSPASAISPASFSTFGDLLRYLRKRAELSQRELALQVGYHYSYMSRIEGNEYTPDPAVLMSRFVPALHLEREAAWTGRLLELASSTPKRPVTLHAEDRSASLPDPVTASEITSIEPRLDLFPVSLTPLLGRQTEVATLVQTLSQRDVRLVTLLGPPGVGKTRLAVQVGTEAAAMFAHGLRFIDLAPLTDPNGFLSVLAQHLGVNDIPDMPLLTRLAQALRQKNLLLVLDNFEQLVEAAPQLYQLLTSTTHIKVLVTSRIPLYLNGENQFAVLPLPLPAAAWFEQTNPAPEALMEFAAIRLFVERARAAQPSFQLSTGNAAAVIEICRRLDGLPLAIELAAARVRTFSPAIMLKEFEHRFEWLARNNQEEQPAKQTLRGAIEWSYTLLSQKEQMLLRRLSVFSGGRTVETAQAICADQETEADESSLSVDEIFDLLVQLTDKSLLYTEMQKEETRFNFLETIHEFAREKLRQSGEETAMKNRHLAYFCELAVQVEREVEFENQTAWLDRGETEHNNMRAALDWSLKAGADLPTGIRMAASLGLFWYLHSHFIEGLERSKVFLEKARAGADQGDLATLLFRTADLHLHRGEIEAAIQLADEAVALCRTLGDKALLAWALYVRGDIYLAVHELTAAEACLREAVAICVEIGYEAVQDIALLLLATILLRQGRLAEAHATVLEGLELARRLSDPWSIASGLQTLGEIMLLHKNYVEAQVNFERSLEASRTVGDQVIVGRGLVNLASLNNLMGEYGASDHYAAEALSIFQLIGDETQQPLPMRLMGYAALQAGNLVRAQVLMRESLSGYMNLNDVSGQLAGLIGMAHCMAAEGNMPEAVRLCALATIHQRANALKFSEVDELSLDSIQKQCLEQLGDAEYMEMVKEGEMLNLADTLSHMFTAPL